ncbi:MAG: hypothetical protein AAFV95_07560 [Bacteroidota bacterium]
MMSQWRILSGICLLACVLLSSAGCHRSKLSTSDPSLAKELEVAVQSFVNCLNQVEESCLDKLYADEFQGLAPLLKPASKQVLIDQIIQNYQNNGLQVEGRVVEQLQGRDLGYVLLDWTIRQVGEGGELKKIFSNRHLQIWMHQKEKGWQLKRSLFYDPNAILF